MGETLGKYELLKRIARGAIADVFLGRHTDDDATGPEGTRGYVAVKRLFPEVTSEPEVGELFLNEVRLAAPLEHANIARVHDVGLEEGILYIAMEYVHGRDLRSVLERGFAADNFIPLELAASVAAQAAAGLHHAHAELNLVHGDVSPQNILVGLDGIVKVCDFGLAKAEQRLGHAEDGVVKGKFSYMAPEQIEGGEADARSDVFALGIVLYETTTMTRLFKADNQYMALEKILYAGIETPTSLRPGYPADLEKIVMKALERDPAARYQTAAELEAALDGWLAQNKASASPVALARYMRGLFSEMPRAAADLSLEVRAAAPAPDAADAAPVKKDVTEMDEKDLDAALDFALGAPSEADFVTRSTPTEEPSDEPLLPPQEPEGIFKADYSNDATMITELPEELREEDARAAQQRAAEEPAVKLPSTVVPTVIVPTVTEEPEVGALGSEPQQPDEPVASVPEPAPTVEAQVPVNLLGTGPHTVAPPPRATQPKPPVKTVPPTAKPPAATSEQRARAEQAFGSDAQADVSLDDLDSVPLSNNKPGIILGLVLVVGLVIGGVLLTRSTGTGEMVAEGIAAKQVDPADLVIEPEPKADRVNVSATFTPPDVYIVVNGVPVQRSDGQIPLIAGVANEINLYSQGFAPLRLTANGDAATPIQAELTAVDPSAPVANLDIVSEPRGATVWVDGVQVGTTPTTATGLVTGAEHYVRIELDGHFPYAGLIGLNTTGEQRAVDVKLEKTDSGRKNYVELVVGAVPRGTVAQVDGESEPLGISPLVKNLDRNRVLALLLTEVDSAPMRRHLALEDVGTFELRPHLTAMKRERGKIVVSVEPSGPNLYVGPNAYGQGPTKALEFPEGKVAVVVETPGGRLEGAVDVLPNVETAYVLRHSGSSLTVEKR